MLDVPVPLMEEQLSVDAFAPHDIQVPEQVIEVPKIFIDEPSARTLCREPQLAVGGSTDDHLLFLVAADCGAERGHSSSKWWCARSSRFSPPEQASTTSSFSLERISERNVDQIVDFPGGRPSRFSPRTWFNGFVHFFARSNWCRGRAVSRGFLALFPGGKKCEDGSAIVVGSECGLHFIHAVRL